MGMAWKWREDGSEDAVEMRMAWEWSENGVKWCESGKGEDGIDGERGMGVGMESEDAVEKGEEIGRARGWVGMRMRMRIGMRILMGEKCEWGASRRTDSMRSMGRGGVDI